MLQAFFDLVLLQWISASGSHPSMQKSIMRSEPLSRVFIETPLHEVNTCHALVGVKSIFFEIEGFELDVFEKLGFADSFERHLSGHQFHTYHS